LIEYTHGGFIFVKKFIIFFCFAILLFHFFQIIYSQRALFTQNYDAVYWKDRFEHSQWVLPLSKRIIGDDGLFAYIGYGLIDGGSITGFDSEVPPLGKYFIGLSIKVFNNPLYYSIFFGLASLALFYMIGARVLKNKIDSLFVISILFLDPLFFSQFWQSALDICQLFFLLAHVLFLTYIVNTKTNIGSRCILYALISGFSLGLFAQVKYPIFLPLILIIESIFFILRNIKREYFAYLIGIGLAILTVNIKFFLDGNSIIDFFRFQKYVLFFYLKSQLIVHKGAIWQMLFFGNFPSLSSGELTRINEWWIAWPMIGIAGLLASIVFILKKKIPFVWKGFGLFVLGSLFILSIIPSYPRYLVIILPFLYLIVVKFVRSFLNKKRIILYLILLLFGITNSFFFLLTKPENSLNGFYYNLSHLYFHDIYQENIVNSDVLGLTRNQFRYIANKAFDDAKIKEIYIKELSKNIPVFSPIGSVKIRVTYKTQELGSFYEEKVIKLVQENGKWEVKWDWSLVFNGFSPDFIVQTETDLGKRGAIINSGGEILAQDYGSYLVSINPEKIDLKKENEMLDFISIIGDVKAPHLQNAYLENSLPGTYVSLVSLAYPLDQKTKVKLLSFPGVKLTPYPSRIYKGMNRLTIMNTLYEECCTRIYSSYNYHGTEGVEKKYDSILWGYSGGKILIKDSKGAIIRVVFEKDKRDGEDVILK